MGAQDSCCWRDVHLTFCEIINIFGSSVFMDDYVDTLYI